MTILAWVALVALGTKITMNLLTYSYLDDKDKGITISVLSVLQIVVIILCGRVIGWW